MAEAQTLSGPDLAQGVRFAEIADGALLLGHVGEEAVLLARRGEALFAVGASCTHYGGPLAEGLMVGDTVRCPWHHACFSLRTGAVLRAPARDPIACWQVERRGETVHVTGKREPAPAAVTKPADGSPRSIVIIGGGAAGNSAAETLRREGYGGRITLFSSDCDGPYDRPNLSKDYLAGQAPEAWMPLRSPDFYREHDIDLRIDARVSAIHPKAREVELSDSGRHTYDVLLLATGAQPVRLDTPGGDLPHVRYLRSLADCRAIIARLGDAKRAVVIGASFIGLEVAASLRTRGLEVDVVAPDAVPMQRVLGPEIGGLVRTLHEAKGVRFHLGATVASIEAGKVTLSTGETLMADLVVVGVGVRPRIALAEAAGLKIDRGVAVDPYLQTSAPGVYAAGDIARWPDPHTGQDIRVEHWVVAERQGQTAARNMIGGREAFDAAPFFWSRHYDTSIHYVGHAEAWDRSEIDGRVEALDCRVSYYAGDKLLAVATIGRDIESLKAERDIEQG